MIRFGLGACSVALCATCTEAPDDRSRFTVRDSLGVRMVENVSPVWTDAMAWHLSRAPAIELGGPSAVGGDALYSVRGAARLANGTFVIANGGNHELRWYDAEGQFLRRAGGEGSGPGEFRSLGGVASRGSDSVIVWDRRNQQLSVFTEEGEFVGSFPIRVPGQVYGVFGDGTLLLGQPASLGDGFMRQEIILRRFHSSTGEADSLGTYVGDEQIVETQPRGQGFMVRIQQPPFFRSGEFVVRGQMYLVSDQAQYEVRVFRNDGTLTSVVRVVRPDAPVRSEDVAAFQQRVLDGADGSALPALRRQFAESKYPEVFPAHGVMVVDALGNLWVQEYPKPGASTVEWLVFGADFRLLGPVTLPLALEVYAIGDDYVLGKWRDELDVEHVGTYELLKP